MVRGGIRTVLTVIMDALVVAAIVLTAALVAGFFGSLGQSPIGEWLRGLAAMLTVPLHLPTWQTPYSGSFSADTGASVVLLLAAEWLLSVLRRR